MTKDFERVEDVLNDEDFLAWFSGKPHAAWESWLSAHPEKMPLIEEAVVFLKDIRVKELPVSQEETTQAYSRLLARLETIKQEPAPVYSLKKRTFKRWMSAAAAVLLLVAGFGIWKYTQKEASVSTTYGEIATHQLPDGSTMMLNANSCATLGKDWQEGKDREVWLNGEAFFHVAKTPQKNRFIVHTNDLDVIVTGTQFNIWTRDNKTSVLLTEGSVTIHTAKGEEIKMLPGDFVQIDNHTLEKKKTTGESILAWKDNRIIFDNTPIREAAVMIREHYGINVTVTDSLLENKMLNGMMPNDNLDILLRAIEATKDFRITRTDKEILISTP